MPLAKRPEKSRTRRGRSRNPPEGGGGGGVFGRTHGRTHALIPSELYSLGEVRMRIYIYIYVCVYGTYVYSHTHLSEGVELMGIIVGGAHLFSAVSRRTSLDL